MSEHMNVFAPYENRPAHHEDALTRAFLLVVRAVPVAHSAWLALVDRAHRANKGAGVPPLHELGSPAVETQIGKVPPVQRVLSLLHTDETYLRGANAAPSSRGQVLDGLVTYDDVLAIVLENKPSHHNIWDAQLDVSLPPDTALDPRVACVTWKEVVAAWSGLLSAGHLSTAEGVLLGDFLDYVEEHFPSLCPYSKVAFCGADVERLKRRCRMVLQSIAGDSNVAPHRGWSWFIQLEAGLCASQVALMPKRQGQQLYLMVEVDPGDTMSQAKALYQQVSLPELLVLRTRQWTVEPNLHFAHMTKGLMWPRVTRSVEDYWAFWGGHPGWVRQWRRSEFDKVFADLLAESQATAADQSEFAKHLTNTKRTTFNMCPGLTLKWWLPLEEAGKLDQHGGLESAVRLAIDDAAKVLKLALPSPTLKRQATGT